MKFERNFGVFRENRGFFGVFWIKTVKGFWKGLDRTSKECEKGENRSLKRKICVKS